MVLPHLRMLSAADTCHNIVHGVPECQRQLIRLPQTQHLSQIALGVNIQQQYSFTLHCQSGTQIVHRSAFSNTALLIGNRNDLCLCHWDFPP